MRDGDHHVNPLKVHVHLDAETETRLRQLLPEQGSKQARVCFLLTCGVVAAQCAKKRIVPTQTIPDGPPYCPIRVSDEVYEFIKTYASEGEVCMTVASTNLLFAALEALEKAGLKEPASKEEILCLLGVPKSRVPKLARDKILARPRKKSLPSRKEDFLVGIKLLWRALWR